MAITFVQRRKLQNYLLGVFLLVLGVIGVVLWYGFFRSEPTPTIEQPLVVVPPKSIQVNVEFLDSELLDELRPPPAPIPFPEPTDIGRDNPFPPF